MGYCDIDDVNGCVPQQPFTAKTVPSAAQVQGYVEDISAEIEALLPNLGYVVPIDATKSPKSFLLVRNANKWGAAGLAQDARQTAVLRDEGIAGARNAWTQRYLDFMRKLQDAKSPFELPDAERTGSKVEKPLGEMLAGTSDLTDTDYTYPTAPPFSVGMKF